MEMAKSSDDTAIWDQSVMRQVCMQSYIMEMAKNSDNIADSRGEDPP